MVEEANNTLQNKRISDLEKATSINEHILQNHTFVLADLTGKLFIMVSPMLQLVSLALRWNSYFHQQYFRLFRDKSS